MGRREFSLQMEELSEHTHQCDLVGRALDEITTWPELAGLYAVPNGGWRSPATARKLLLEGVKPGVPDLVLTVARGGYMGYYQEQKKPKEGRTSQKQRAWHAWLQAQGYKVEVLQGAEPGWRGLTDYLSLPPTPGVRVLTRRELLQLAYDVLPDWAALARARLEAALACHRD